MVANEGEPGGGSQLLDRLLSLTPARQSQALQKPSLAQVVESMRRMTTSQTEVWGGSSLLRLPLCPRKYTVSVLLHLLSFSVFPWVHGLVYLSPREAMSFVWFSCFLCHMWSDTPLGPLLQEENRLEEESQRFS